MRFSNNTDKDGLVELLADLTNTSSSTDSSYSLKKKTRDINMALDDYFSMVKKSSGTWQIDDTNHTKYPNMTFDMVSGQQDYIFTEDEQGNQIQDIYRVEAKDANGNWTLLSPYDEFEQSESIGARALLTGTPTRYFKTADGIFLDVTPNYNSTNGIRMFFTRSPSYFASTDTTKEPGIPNNHHRYLAVKPAYWFWLPRDTRKAQVYKNELLQLENDISGEIAERSRDEPIRMRPRIESCR